MNIGKTFEEQVKKSVPAYALFYRLPDSAQSFGSNKKLRFSRKNPFDYLMWDSKRHKLYALELKTKQGKSISFEREKEDKGDIHYHQIQGLNKWDKYDGITCGFLIEFRELEFTFFLYIDSFNKLTANLDKKSFSYNDLVNSGLDYVVIPQIKKRTRYQYDIESLLIKE